MHQPQPWYRASKDAWYVQIGGKQIRLVKWQNSEKEAYDAFYKLMAARPENLPKPQVIAAAEVLDLYWDRTEKHASHQTYKLYKAFLQDFAIRFGRLPAANLKPFHLSQWLNSHKGWKICRRHATIILKRAFNWADREGIFCPNPFKNITPPPGNRRNRVLSHAEQAEVLAAIPDEPFRDFVIAMIETGCRPSEGARVTASIVDLERGVWIFEQHKTAK